MKIFLILQSIITAMQSRVEMEEDAKMTNMPSNATAKNIILEKPAKVSIIAMVYAFKIYFHNYLLDRFILYVV